MYLQDANGKWFDYTLKPVDDPTAQPVTPPTPPPAEPVIPANAKVFNMLPNNVPWKMNHDAGTPGDSSGTTTYPVTAPNGEQARLLDFTTKAKGGEIFHVNVTDDASTFNTFCVRARRMATSWAGVMCEETDLEHADATGVYQDLATQLDGYSGTVDVTWNHGWNHLNIKANPNTRDPKLVYESHIYSKDNGNGTITYIGINLDGKYYPINKTVSSTGSTKWNPKVLNLQVQYDGASAGSIETKIYLLTLDVIAWES